MLTLAHKNLDVYHHAVSLVKEIYKITKDYPKEEQYGLVSQLRRAAISVCSNIAEGSSRYSPREKKRFYEIARSSLVEIDAQIEISLVLKYTDNNVIFNFEKFHLATFRMISQLIQYWSQQH